MDLREALEGDLQVVMWCLNTEYYKQEVVQVLLQISLLTVNLFENLPYRRKILKVASVFDVCVSWSSSSYAMP
jgi:hypothetical protein